MVNSISFPGLFDKVFQIDRVAFNIFGKDIMWYGVIIAFGFMLAVLYAGINCKEYNWDHDSLIDGVLLALPCAIVGARAYYVIFEWDYYRQNPGQILAIWKGGLGIYGAIIATVIAVYFFCKKRRGDILSAFDMVSMSYLLAQGIGRWGNFVNAEAHGGITNMPWGMVINGGAPVHPTFLYESIWDLAGFAFLFFYHKKRKFRGEISLMYLGWYGMIRFLTEFLRTDSLYIGNTGIRTSQLVGGLCVVVSVGLLTYFYTTKKYPKPFVKTGEEILEVEATKDCIEETNEE